MHTLSSSLLLALGLALGAAACDGEDSLCHETSGVDLTSPTVGFRTDVLPILRNSCGLSQACHGSEASSGGYFYLGPSNAMGAATDAQIGAIFDQTVGVATTLTTGVPRVKAGDPANSFLMHKIDGTLQCATLSCAATNECGTTMPQGGPLLAEAQRDTIRRWIAQGAKND
ncbi:hypothetical protein L6R52_23350 [Myxococcota bacterium]|nr:hypothetical protein [Myxococcota bacterium]